MPTLLLFALLVFYSHTVSSHQTATGSDTTNLFLPQKFTAQSFLSRGHLPLWNPYRFCGSPLLANPQAAIFYPPERLLYFLLPPILAHNLTILLHLFLLALFSYLLLRHGFQCAPWVSFTLALILPLSPLLYRQFDHPNQIASFAWFPLLFLLLIRGLKSQKFTPLFPAVLALQILAGHPQYVSLSVLFLFLYLVGQLVLAQELNTLRRLRVFSFFLLSLMLALLLTAAQLIPTYELLQLSYRRFSSFDYSAGFSLQPSFLVNYLNPKLYYLVRDLLPTGEIALYCGVLPLLLFLLSIILHLKKSFVPFIILLALFFFFLLFSLGKHTPLFKVVYYLYPPLKGTRVPARATLFANTALLILAALALQRLYQECLRPLGSSLRLTTLLLLFLPLFVFLDLFISSQGENFRKSIDLHKQLNSPQPWERFTEDQSTFRIFRMMLNDSVFYEHFAPPAVAARFQRLQPDLNQFFQLPLLYGYEEALLPTVRFKDFMLTFNRNFRNPYPDADLLALLNVKYIYSEHIKGEPPIYSPQFKTHPLPSQWRDYLDYLIYENRKSCSTVGWLLPARLRYQLEQLEGNYYRSGELQLSYGNEIKDVHNYRFPETFFQQLEERFPVPTIRELPNGYEITKLAAQKGYLYLSQATYPGWRVQHGRQKSPLRPLNAFMSAFYAPHGVKTLRLCFEPFSLKLGLFISLLTLTVLLTLILVSTALPQKKDDLAQPQLNDS